MRKIQLLSMLLMLNSIITWAQNYVSISKDTLIESRYYLFKGEIYQGGQLQDRVNYILVDNDTVLVGNLRLIPVLIKADFTAQKSNYVKTFPASRYIIVNIPEETFQGDTCWLYDSRGQLLRYFTYKYNIAQFDTAKVANGFRVVFPSAPVLQYSTDDLKDLPLHSKSYQESNYLIANNLNGEQIVIPKLDKSIAYFSLRSNLLGKVDPLQDSVFLVNSGYYYNEAENEWIKNSPKISGYLFFAVLMAVIIIIGAIIWFLFGEKHPVYAIYDGTSFTSFAAAFRTTNKFIIKSNNAFHGVNLESSSEKKDLKDSLAGNFLLVDEKYGFSLGRLSRNFKRPVYCRKNNSQEDMVSFCDKIKIRESNLKAMNPQVFRRKKYTITTDYLIGYTYKNRTPHSLEELLASLGLSYGDPAIQQKLAGMNQYQQAQTLKVGVEQGNIGHVQSGPYADQKNIAGHLDEIWGKISSKFSDIETKLSTVENRINILDDDFNQKNKGKPSVDMSFFKPEAQNTSYCLNRLINIEKDLVNYVGQLRSDEVELQYFLNSTISRFLSKQITVKEKQAFWMPLMDAINSNMVLAHEDLVYKNLAEDISQFSNPLDKATYLNRQLFNDLWDCSLSNVLVMLEELRNTESFLKQTIDGNILSDIRGFAEQNIEAVLEIAKSLDLKITYLPLFAQYENFNLKDLDIDIFTSFNYFYNNVRSKLDKNHIVQILSYGITSSKTDRSTKTKIKIMS